MPAQKIYLAMPLYENQLHLGAAIAFWSNATRTHHIHRSTCEASLIPTTCQTLWCDALNRRQELGVQWFAMLHTDVQPESWWLDTLIAEAEQHEADFVSAVVPLKNEEGLTSTAIASRTSRFGSFCRLTQAQVNYETFPTTFGIDEAVDALARLPAELQIADAPRTALLCNTGCMLCRLDRPWCEIPQVCFNDLNGREKDRDGKWQPVLRSEDWEFSHRIAEHGGRVMATKAVGLLHWGKYAFPLRTVWGKPRDASL